MSLAGVLAAVDELHDLPALMADLGNQAIWQDIAPIHGADRAAIIGRRGDLEWLGLEVRGAPGPAAERVARRLIASGRVAGLVALSRPRRELAVAVAYGGGGALVVRLDSPGAVALAVLRRLRSASGACATAFAARAAEILAGEDVGHAFFRQFRATLGAFTDAISARRRLSKEDRRTLALVQLTRVLFLYFVQSKGWLDGREDYLARAVDDCLSRRRSLQRCLLEPLFFGTLNRPLSERSRRLASFGSIPFLNGGLFEPHPLERRARPDLPDDVWRNAFDSLFERFHFTAAESGAGGPSIAPDMLGRVFEGVMSPADRKASGTFYTPAALVTDVVDAAVAAALGARRSCSDAVAIDLIVRGDHAALSEVVSFTILDPACGSGAFLLGALERIAAHRVRLGESRTAARREALRRNLFGVDSDAIAVRLAELRLWLAVIADDPATVHDHPEPLPNLGCFVRQGDSLFAPLGSVAASGETAERIRALRFELTDATGAHKRRLARALVALELDIAGQHCRLEEARLEREARQLIAVARTPDLFGRPPRPGRRFRDDLAALRADLRTVRAARRRLAGAEEVPWFHYESAFADVFASGGFDLIVGNPPWVRAEELPSVTRERLAARFRWWRTARGPGFAHQPDLSIAFLERAHELVRSGGAVAMLLPSKLLTTGYGTAARASLAATMTVHAAANLARDPRAVFGATVYPMALVTSRRRPPRAQRVRDVLEPAAGPLVPQERLGAEPWVIDASAELAARLRARLPRLGERFRCALGVKTGADDVFLDPPDVEPELLRWAVRGRDIRPFAARPVRRILWTHDATGRPLDRMPPRARQHFEGHDRALRARADYVRGPAWTLFRVDAASGAHRVVWADLAVQLSAVPLTGTDADLVALNTCYVVQTRTSRDARALAAWLNSAWLRALARSAATPASAGYVRFAAQTVSALPLFPHTSRDDFAELAACAMRGQAVQKAIDDLSATTLDLDRADRRTLAELADTATNRR